MDVTTEDVSITVFASYQVSHRGKETRKANTLLSAYCSQWVQYSSTIPAAIEAFVSYTRSLVICSLTRRVSVHRETKQDPRDYTHSSSSMTLYLGAAVL